MDKTNFIVIIHTENLKCNHNGLKLYGQPASDTLVADVSVDRQYFTGTFEILMLGNFSENDGFNECIYSQICDGGCYYISIVVENGADEAGWKLCEVEFS